MLNITCSLPAHSEVGSYLEALEDDSVKDVNVMVVEDEWGDLVAYGSIACDSVEQTTRDAAYRAKIRECYPKVRIPSYPSALNPQKLVIVLYSYSE